MKKLLITDVARMHCRNISMLRRKAKDMGLLIYDDNGRTCVKEEDVDHLINESIDYIIDPSKAHYSDDHKYVTINSQRHITGISKDAATSRMKALDIKREYVNIKSANGKIAKYACITVADAIRIKSYIAEPNKHFTYLGTDASGLWKIGQTDAMTQRERAMKAMNPTYKIKYIGAVRFESKLHEFFKNKRVSGEWYCLTPTDVECIVSTLGLKPVS